MNQRIVWYRVADTNIQTVGQGSLNVSGTGGTGNVLTVINGTGDGTYPAGATVNLAATAPPTNKVFEAWTGDISGVADVKSPNTTLVMPNSAVTLSAVYRWAPRDDKIRFFPAPGQEQQMLTCLWEGTNGDKDTGPYEVFYQPDQVPGQVPQVRAPVSGSYTFRVTADDGVRLFLGGVKVIEGWKDQSPTTYTCVADLAEGALYDIELHFDERTSGAVCRLHWSYPGQSDQAVPPTQLFPPGGLTREVWTGVAGNSVSNIPTGLSPNPANKLASFEAPTNWADNYGTRVRGYVTAPATGNYRFWIASDNASELWLSTDDSPANRRRIARVIGGTSSRQ
jgi:PA14 domain/Divergent InlB B-repeat domain